MLDPRRGWSGFHTVGFFKLGKIARDALLNMGLAPRQLALGVVFLVRVQRAQVSAIDRDHAATDQAKGTADGNKSLARDLDRTSIVMAEF